MGTPKEIFLPREEKRPANVCELGHFWSRFELIIPRDSLCGRSAVTRCPSARRNAPLALSLPPSFLLLWFLGHANRPTLTQQSRSRKIAVPDSETRKIPENVATPSKKPEAGHGGGRTRARAPMGGGRMQAFEPKKLSPLRRRIPEKESREFLTRSRAQNTSNRSHETNKLDQQYSWPAEYKP